jgi:PAS domain S-box-containing protein
LSGYTNFGFSSVREVNYGGAGFGANDTKIKSGREDMPPFAGFPNAGFSRWRKAGDDRDKVRSLNQRIFETSLDLILVVDSRGAYLRVSPSSVSIVGYAPEEMIGQNGVRFILPDDLAMARSEMRQMREGRQLHNFTCRYRHKDGQAVTLAWTGQWSEPDRQYFFIGRDMTSQIEAEQQARDIQQLQAVNQLTGGLAHDFNNLLAVIMGSLELLDPYVRQDFEAAEHLLDALNAASRGAEITAQLLAFARRQPPNSQAVNINACVAEVLEALREKHGPRVRIDLQAAQNLWRAVADASQMKAALDGLCQNAADASPDGGVITIRSANKSLESADLHGNPDATAGDYVMLAVRDNGKGMTPQELERVFEPFFTTRQDGPAAGLGLSIIRSLLKQQRGHIEIESEPGNGTEVRLYLPRAKTHAPVQDQELQRQPANRNARTVDAELRILVVEDDDDVRRIVVAQLAALGYRCDSTGNAEAALDMLNKDRSFDLLFSDVLLPGGMSGMELANAARKLRPEMKILLTSGFVGTAGIGEASADHFVNFLAKPYRRADLSAAIKAILSED